MSTTKRPRSDSGTSGYQPIEQSISFEHVKQQSAECVKDDHIRRFCALTPYKYSLALRLATKTNQSAVEWLKIMFGNQLVGIVVLQNIENGWGHVILQHILIEPSYRNKGIGSKTVRYITERAERVTLGATNEDTVAFYSARGFQMVLDAEQGIHIMSKILGVEPEWRPDTSVLACGTMSTAAMSITEAFKLGQRWSF